jgi:SH3-like domain-containing protein
MAGLRAILGAAVALCLALAAPETGRAGAGDGVGPVTKLPLPRYVSLRSGKVNARRGPGLEYRIDWVFQRAGLPVRVVDEYENWRRIVDSDEAGGWVYHSLLSARRTALVTAAEVTFREAPAETAPATAKAGRGVVATLLACRAEWCEVEAKGVSGWVPKAAIWGVEAGEEFGG